MFKLSDPDRGLLEQTYVLRFRLKFGTLFIKLFYIRVILQEIIKIYIFNLHILAYLLHTIVVRY